jgi:large subunit ribosomal protein L3
MSALFDPVSGDRIPVTVLQIDGCQVVGHKTFDVHGYWAVQVGYGSRRPKNVKRPMLGVYAKLGIPPKATIMEFKVRGKEGLLPIGTILEPSWFKEGQLIDARSKTKGKGFAGVCLCLWTFWTCTNQICRE